MPSAHRHITCRPLKSLSKALTESIASKKPCLIDVQLGADSGKESGHIGYLNPAPLVDIKV